MKSALVVLIVSILTASEGLAHKASDSYLRLRANDSGVEGQWDIALRDLEFALGLDADGSGEITWGELRARHQEIASYALERLKIKADGQDCPLQATDHEVDRHSDGAYEVLRFTATCPAATEKIEIGYRLFFDFDLLHRGLTSIERKGVVTTAIFSPDRQLQAIDLRESSRLRQFMEYLEEGIWHIWIGFDHILFLLALLLPAVLWRNGKAWQPVDRFGPAFWEVCKIVTTFTIAHSITLSAAALGILTLPSRWVESIIALSVVLAALNNLFPLIKHDRWRMAFIFGLIHGFGFASVLADLGLPQGALVLALIGFNVGVEVGQLAIVAAFLPTIYFARHTWFYRRLLFQGGSAAAAVIALIWFIQRAFDL